MRLDDYVITERDERRFAAALSDPETRKRVEQSLDEVYKKQHCRIQYEGYVLRPEDVPAYQQWLAKHPEFYKNKHPHK